MDATDWKAIIKIVQWLCDIDGLWSHFNLWLPQIGAWNSSISGRIYNWRHWRFQIWSAKNWTDWPQSRCSFSGIRWSCIRWWYTKNYRCSIHISSIESVNDINDFYWVSGLDPAGPGYDAFNIGLNKSCAQFVQVLHTEAGRSGTANLRGDADFFANKFSSNQPGCEFEQCSHNKAAFYYYASLFSPNKFIGVDCSLLLKNASHHSLFGAFNGGESGVFCFATNRCYPYVKNNWMKKQSSPLYYAQGVLRQKFLELNKCLYKMQHTWINNTTDLNFMCNLQLVHRFSCKVD